MSQREAAAHLNISKATLERALRHPRVRQAWEDGSTKGLVTLRRILWMHAAEDAKTARYLASHYLGLPETPRGGDVNVSVGATTVNQVNVSSDEMRLRVQELAQKLGLVKDAKLRQLKADPPRRPLKAAG
jgi:hypothetical protein